MKTHWLVEQTFWVRVSIAFIITFGTWVVVLMPLSASVNLYPQWWDSLTKSWGYTRFRDWGDPAYWILTASMLPLFAVTFTVIERIRWRLQKKSAPAFG